MPEVPNEPRIILDRNSQVGFDQRMATEAFAKIQGARSPTHFVPIIRYAPSNL